LLLLLLLLALVRSPLHAAATHNTHTTRDTPRPSRELWAALQQHILASLHLFDQQSLSCTIWAAAKFSAAGAGGATAAAPLSQPAPGDAAAAEAEEQDARRQQRAQQALVAALMRRCDPQMRQWQGRHLAQAAWGLACLGARPDAAWAEVGGGGWCEGTCVRSAPPPEQQARQQAPQHGTHLLP
jgi:hypothetical protein